MRVRILSDADALAELAATTIARALSRVGHPRASLALAGGSTPRATYRRLIEEEVDWGRVDAWLGDERWVPPDHPRNNGRLAWDTFLHRLPATLHRVPYEEDLDPREAARRYEQTLGRIITSEDGRLRPDLVLLGMGEDGHTASLFPGEPALTETGSLYVATFVESKQSWRLTATLPLLHAARRIVFLVAGESKAGPLRAVLEGTGPPLPARLVAAGAEDVTFLVDEAAAEHLTTTPVEHI